MGSISEPSLRTLCVLVLAVGVLDGCCTTARCLDRHSGPDRMRVKATPVELGVVHNESVSAPKRDRTDWRFVDLTQPGKLTAQLHWDNGRAKLELAVFDVLGVKIQQARPWGTGGLRAIIAVEDPGRYYVRVRGTGKKDGSPYALRLMFRPDARHVQCHDCKPGDRRCLGKSGYIVCERISAECNAWSKTFACAAGAPCRNGTCSGCGRECRSGGRRCAGSDAFQLCEATPDGCMGWGPKKQCAGNKRCRSGRCVRPTVKQPKPEPPPAVKKSPVRSKIISIYHYRGRMTLHIEIGDNPDIKPGQVGTVLAGDSNDPLPGGRIKISKVAGRYAIATTDLDKLGKNRWVRIKVR